VAAELYRTISETLAALARGSTRVANGPAATAFDYEAVLRSIGGDERLLAEMAALFAVECPKYMQAIKEAIARHDAAALERAAHAIRGSMNYFGAPAAAAALDELETMARAGVLDGAADICQALEVAVCQQLDPVLARLTKNGS
jgi:HPt (histidine-containing phosphotransfer) domain-containing protein